MLAPLVLVTAQVAVDLQESARHVVHARLTIPVTAGPVTLRYPKWIPGEHGPTGPIKDIAGLTMSAAGKTLDWSRDPRDMYAFRVEAPVGTASIEVSFDLLSSAVTEGFSSGASTTSRLALLSWNQVVLYPDGTKGDAIDYEAKLTLPPGWTIGTALPVKSRSGGVVSFEPVSLTRLVDSPVLAGQHLKEVPLGDGVVLDVAADNPEALVLPPEVEAGFKGLVAEADALFGSRHYAKYHFLLTVSDQVAHFGLEHHESSDDRVRERVFLDPDVRETMLGLLPHEYVHSWNGKYRRPADLLPDDFASPIDSSLLWVYEGLTQYLGWVLTSRSGLRTAALGLDDLALSTAELDHREGRKWRPLEDTATAAQLLYETPDLWGSWRRSVDFYDEGTLIWLEADVTIRRLTKGAKSLDDFCKRFHGGPGGKADLKTYRFDDVVEALNATAPNDWATFLRERVRRRGDGAPLEGIEKGGWKLDYTATRSALQVSLEDVRETSDFRYAIGVQVKKDGTVCDVVPDSPAWKAGVAPGMAILAVNDLKFDSARLRDAVRAAESIRLILQNGESFLTAEIPDTGGERYPHLARAAGDDILGTILAPRSGKAYKKN
jgi:predicted metalloprotease with PDZ domain